MTCRIDRGEVMRDAWRRYRDGQRLGLGWDFSRCLRVAWTAAKIRAEFPRRSYQPVDRGERIHDLLAVINHVHGETLERLAR